MAALHRVAASGVLAVLLSSTVLQAQVTAPEVWQDWQAALGANAATTLTVGSEDYSGGTLTLRDVTLTLTDEGATVTSTLPQLVLTEQGDGSVAITMSETSPLHVTAETDDGAPSEIHFEAEHPGAAITATGTPGALNFAIDIPLLALNLTDIAVEDRDYQASGRFALNGLAGEYATADNADLIDVTYDLAATDFDFTFLLEETDSSATPPRAISFTAEGSVADLRSAATMTLPENAADLDEDQALIAGFAIDGSQSSGASEITFRAVEDGTVTEGRIALGGASATALAGGTDIAYALDLTDIAFALTGGEMPFPLNFTAAKNSLAIAMPLVPSATPSPFVFDLDLTDLVLNEEIWSLFDPQKTIPRDPAGLRIDLAGLANIPEDGAETAAPTAPAAPAKPGMSAPVAGEDDFAMGLPAQIHSVDINAIDITFGGARIAAEGALTFDPADWLGDEMPMPVGTIGLTLAGLNGLTQKLSAIGLIPAEQVMGMMMMLGMFTIPTGDDEMRSEIEFTPEGGIKANGQQVF